MGLFSSRRTPESVGDRLASASDRVRETAGEYLGTAREQWDDVSDAVRKHGARYSERTSEAAQELDRHVREHPWPYVAGGIAFGLAVGLVLGSRR